MDFAGYGDVGMPSAGSAMRGAVERQPPSNMFGGTVLPEKHEEQIKFGFRMIDEAFNSKVQQKEAELKSLRTQSEELKDQASGLQRKNSALEVELVESQQRSQTLTQENRDLFQTVQNLRKQLMRLEGLKKNVLSAMTDDGIDPEDDPGRRSLASAYVGEPLANGGYTGAVGSSSLRPGSPGSQWSPSGTAAGVGSAAAGAANGRPSSPARADGQGLDGKAFFRAARSQLPYELFNDFLASIKRLNSHQQTAEETLDQARRIFGPELQHLYAEFEQLLSRHAIAP